MYNEITGLDDATISKGRKVFLLMIMLSLAALIAGINATWSCDFAQRKVVPYDQYELEQMCSNANYTGFEEENLCVQYFKDPGVGYYGWQLVTISDHAVCMSYEMVVPVFGWVRPDFDAAFYCGYAFSVLANVMCACGWFTIIMATCCPVSQARIKGLSLYFAVACLAQGLSFLIFASDVCKAGFFQTYFPLVDLDTYISEVSCSLGDGGIMAIVATCLHFVCIFLAPLSIAIPPYGYKNQWEHDGPIQMEQPVITPSTGATKKKKQYTGAPLQIIIAGAPASGKGTQCEMIQEKYGVVHLSTGDMLRAAVAAGTKVGKVAKEYMDSGALVPDYVIIDVVKERLEKSDCKEQGWLLDGFPRTKVQAKALEDAGIMPDCFLFLAVPDDTLVKRVVGRRNDPVTGKIYHMEFSPPSDPEVLARLEQRSDDTEEKVKVRLQQFHANVDAVKDSYTDIIATIDGYKIPTDVFEDIVKAINSKRPSARKKHIKIIIAGAPASGKGTQCEAIKEEFGVVHLSTGDMLRAAVADGTTVGKSAKEYMDSGKLVPDEVIIGVVKDRLDQDDCRKKGWLLDGFPRTQAQARALEEAGIQADCFLFLNVPDEILVERVVGRRTDPVTGKIYHMKFSPPSDPEVLARLEQRSDDTEEKVKVRLEQFHANVDAVKGSYKDISVMIDGNQPPNAVFISVFEAIESKLSPV